MATEINVNGKEYEQLFTFPIPRIGWEMDNKGYIAQDIKGKKVVILTSHNMLYVSNVKALIELINEQKDIVSRSEKALRILESK